MEQLMERLKNISFDVLPWRTQSPDLNLTEMMWRALQRAVHKQTPNELTQCCKDNRAKIPPQ